jgi:hypothetical protein
VRCWRDLDSADTATDLALSDEIANSTAGAADLTGLSKTLEELFPCP